MRYERNWHTDNIIVLSIRMLNKVYQKDFPVIETSIKMQKIFKFVHSDFLLIQSQIRFVYKKLIINSSIIFIHNLGTILLNRLSIIHLLNEIELLPPNEMFGSELGGRLYQSIKQRFSRQSHNVC